MTSENKVIKEYREVKDDYAFNESIFNDGEERAEKLKYIINDKLTLIDKTIIILYAELRSYRKLGKKMGLSHMTVRKEVKRIREEILKEYRKL